MHYSPLNFTPFLPAGWHIFPDFHESLFKSIESVPALVKRFCANQINVSNNCLKKFTKSKGFGVERRRTY
jgi:hypothetical protein